VDNDGDTLVDCDDTHVDDICSCSYACACYGQGGGCDPTDHVCDGSYDPDVIDLGTVLSGISYQFDIDTSDTGVVADYDMEGCHGTLDSTMPDQVIFFTLATQADISFEFTQDPGADHSGLLMYADRCRACDEPGPGNVNEIFCYYTNSPWMQNNLEPGSYALLVKALLSADGTTIMSGQFTGFLHVDP
jgi:hypothetical protein